VGREDLLALALRRWQKAFDGSGHLLLLGGEAGIGKSRLLDELADRIAAPRTVQVGAFPSDRETPGVLLLELAGELRTAGEADAADRIRNLVLDEGAGDFSRRRRLLVAELTAILQEVLAQPMLLRIEDVQWADELSLDVFERVAGNLRNEPSMAVLTYRSDELYSQSDFQLWRTRLLGQRRAEEVMLARLDADGTARMFTSIVGREAASDELERLYESSDGIPLHIEELVAGGLDQVPDTIAEAVIERTGRLRPRTRETLAAAAVLGRSFDAALLARITGDTPIEVELMLDELISEHFATVRPDGRTYDFRHALIRDAVYEDIGLARRRALHAAVAEAVEEAGFPDAAISDHFERAGLAAEAYARAVAAADHAVKLSAHREAAELLERAERTMPTASPPGAEADLHRRLAGELAAIDDNEAAEREYLRAIDLLREQGDEVGAAELVPWLVATRHLLGADLNARMRDLDDALARLSGLPEYDTRPARTHLLGALAAANMLDRRLEDALEYGRRASELFTDDDLETRIGVDATIGSVLVFAGEGEVGWRMLEETTTQAVDAGLEAAAARSYRMLGSSASMLGDYSRGERWLSEGIAYTTRVERWNDHHYLVAHLANVRWETGDTATAFALASRALADGRCAITTRVTALHVLGYVALASADAERAAELLGEAREIGEEMHELQRLSPALWGLAELALREGKHAQAVELSERGHADSARVSDAAYLFPFVVTGTRAHLAVGGPAAARDWLARCAVLLHRRDIPVTLPALDHAEGLIELAEGRPGQARAALERAAEGWRASGRWWELTQSLIDRAICAARSKSPALASDLLAEARTSATAAGATALLKQAAAAASGSPRDDGTYPLTAREVEVARLVATGSTNRQIASSLSIAPKTVGSHIEHILAKLGAARRAEIAAWSAAHPRRPAS
jgi:ATP/maltotriose-dependent transcriptional regulator MalT